jgi:DNA-binding protein YbaB
MFDINKILKEFSNAKVTPEDKNAIFIGNAGDEDMGVTLQIDGCRNIKSIKFTDGLKDFIHESKEDFWQLLPDLIIAAFSNAISQIANDSTEDDTDSSDMMSKISKMTENFGGMDQILKSLGSANPNDLMKNMTSLIGNGSSKKKK